MPAKVHDEARTLNCRIRTFKTCLEGVLAVYIKRLKNVPTFVLAITYLEICLREFSEIYTRIFTNLLLKMLFIIVKNVKYHVCPNLEKLKLWHICILKYCTVVK